MILMNAFKHTACVCMTEVMYCVSVCVCVSCIVLCVCVCARIIVVFCVCVHVCVCTLAVGMWIVLFGFTERPISCRLYNMLFFPSQAWRICLLHKEMVIFEIMQNYSNQTKPRRQKQEKQLLIKC